MNTMVDRRIATNPKQLAQDLPGWLNYVPSEKLVMIGTSDDIVEQIIELDLSNNTINEVEDFVDDDLAYIFCLYTTRPSVYKKLANKLFYTSSCSYVREIMWIKNNRWASYLCLDLECCPKRGNEIVTDMSKVSA